MIRNKIRYLDFNLLPHLLPQPEGQLFCCAGIPLLGVRVTFLILILPTMELDMSFKNSSRSGELSDAEKAAQSSPPTVLEEEETRKITGVRVSSRGWR